MSKQKSRKLEYDNFTVIFKVDKDVVINIHQGVVGSEVVISAKDIKEVDRQLLKWEEYCARK